MKKKMGWMGLIVVILSMVALSATACSKDEEPSLLTTTGTIVSLAERELSYQDNQGLGSGNIIPVPITFIELREEIQVTNYLLVGPYVFKEGDNVRLTYIPDNEVTSWEIWNRYYPDSSSSALHAPDVHFKVNGYVNAWEKK